MNSAMESRPTPSRTTTIPGEGVMFFTLHSGFGELRRTPLKSATMPVLRSRSSTKLEEGNNCQCCPYGYHIDVDFVQYCETLYKNSHLDQLEQMKKNKQKTKKSMKPYLHEDSSQPHTPPSPQDLLTTNDALRDAVQDFEETFLSANSPSKSTSHEPQDLALSMNALKMSDVSVLSDSSFTDVIPGPLSKNASCGFSAENSLSEKPLRGEFRIPNDSVSYVSSSSSQSTLSNTRIQLFFSPSEMYPVFTGSQQIAYTLEALNSATSQSPVTSPGGSVIPKPVLENIRQQMATSLEKMRELEEKVKNLAVLKVQLSVLKEEKRLLLLQIKAKENKVSTRLDVKPVKQRSKSDGEAELEEGSSPRFHGPSKFSSYFKRKTFVHSSLAADSSQRSLELREDGLSSPGLTANLSASISRNKQLDNSDMQQKSFNDHEVSWNESMNVKRVNNLKTAATSKLLSTQDIGIGYGPEETRSIAVGDTNVHVTSQYTCKKCGQQEVRQSALSSSFSSETSENRLELKKVSKYKLIPQTISCKTFQTLNTSTDGCTNNKQLDVDQIPFDTQEHVSIVPQPQFCTNCQEKLPQKLQDIAVGDCVPVSDISSKCKSSLMVTCGMNTEATVQQDSGTCTELKMTDVLSQQDLISRKHEVASSGYSTTISVGLQVSPQVVETKNVALQTTTTDVQHVCVQTDMVNYCLRQNVTGKVSHVVCKRCCNVETLNTGIEPYSIFDETCQHCIRFQAEKTDVGTDCQLKTCIETDTRTVGCGDLLVSEVCCDHCKVYQTETVGVGDEDVNSVLCDRCVNLKVDVETFGEDIIQRHSIGINTSFETGLLDLLEPSSLNSVGIHLCDKCNATIYSVAQDITGKNTSPASVSRHLIHCTQIPTPKKVLNVYSESVVSELCPQLKMEETDTVEQHSVIKVQKEASLSSSDLQNSRAGLAVDEESFLKQDILQKNSNTKSYRLKAIRPSCGSESDTTESSGPDSSPEEDSYDGIAGNIVNHCVDDLAVELKKPGTEIFEPVHRVKTELSKEMKAACKVLNDYLLKPGNKDEKKMKSCFAVIQQEWFKVMSQQSVNPHVLEDYLDALEEFSNQLLSHVVNLTDNNGNTAMHYAVSYGNFDVVSILLDSKVCDVTKHNKAGYNCMMLLSLTDMKNDTRRDVTKRLFHLGDINAKASQNGQTALMLAVSQNNVKVVEMLLEAGAEVNLQDNDGSTALMCAAEHGHRELVKLLLCHPDCDLYLTDRDGSTALSICMEAGHQDLGLLIYSSMNFSRGSLPYSSLKRRRKDYALNRSLPTPRTPPSPPR
ncbi:uncharacterized protein LOC143248591 isoform X2 [Tachypleus tridentatus]|uniref:uncharacterized protein LOC143248591 isoform X2 n=1 Tax=Tachypleus tridentatus TaxID=6853 RepID=UPI003FD56FB8